MIQFKCYNFYIKQLGNDFLLKFIKKHEFKAVSDFVTSSWHSTDFVTSQFIAILLNWL